jgi:rhodanese-related sulfurtransferase
VREGTEVGCGALTVAVVVSHGIGGDPARDGSTGADAPVAFVAGAEVPAGVALEVVPEGVIDGVADVPAVGEAGVADPPVAGDAAVPEPFEHPARPAIPASSTSAMPAPPRRPPMRERTAVTGERLPRGLASIVAPSRLAPLRKPPEDPIVLSAVPSVSASDVPPDAVVLDVREDDEWAAGHIDGAHHIPMGELPGRFGSVADLAGDSPELVVVCRSGHRSARVVAWLAQNGVDAVNLAGGMGAWVSAGRPMVSETGGAPFVR